MLTSSLALLSAASLALAQTPLVSQRFQYGSLPNKADTFTGGRGPQSGTNICNSTTEGPTSQCQTAIINDASDFCLWGPPEPNSLIGNTEGEAVAWCTKPGHGTRIIPAGAITGVQFIKTPDYVQVTGFINQVSINIAADDSGGEMDSAGADQRGNPLGGLVFSQAWNGTVANQNYVQAVYWHNFMGANIFCLKACDPSRPNGARYCEHIYDRIGCRYNAPSNNTVGQFLSCQGDSQRFPGVYVQNGQTLTYTQPPESLGAISTIPYQPEVPPSSLCTTFESAQLFSAAASVAPAVSSGVSSTALSSGASRPAITSSGSGSSRPAASSAAGASAAPSSRVGAASHMAVGTGAISVAVLLALVVLA